MLQIRWRLGLRPRPRWGSLQRSPDPLAVMGWDRDLMTPSLGSANTPPPRPKSWKMPAPDESLCFASS